MNIDIPLHSSDEELAHILREKGDLDQAVKVALGFRHLFALLCDDIALNYDARKARQAAYNEALHWLDVQVLLAEQRNALRYILDRMVK